jgi:serine/threonine-protein kinase
MSDPTLGPLKPGDVVGDYVVERVIGTGGMATVAAASHMLRGDRVAIKLLLPKRAKNETVRKRFEREMRTMQQLRGDHAIRLLDFGNHAGSPFMVMELLEGSDLDEVLKTRTLPVEEAVTYLLQTLEVVAEAHARGITHRDLKPGNLFLAQTARGPCIKVLDFGISKASGPQKDLGEATLTEAAAVFGSPFYMSPEQLLSTRDVDHRTDIWALGITLHRLLTGQLPFEAKTPVKVCRRILNGTPTPLREQGPHFPAALESVILRCLKKKREERYPTVADLALALGPFAPRQARLSLAFVTSCMRPAESEDDPTTGRFETYAHAGAPVHPGAPTAEASGAYRALAAMPADGSGAYPSVGPSPIAAPSSTTTVPQPPSVGGDPRETTTVFNKPPSMAAPAGRSWTAPVAALALGAGVAIGWLLPRPQAVPLAALPAIPIVLPAASAPAPEPRGDGDRDEPGAAPSPSGERDAPSEREILGASGPAVGADDVVERTRAVGGAEGARPPAAAKAKAAPKPAGAEAATAVPAAPAAAKSDTQAPQPAPPAPAPSAPKAPAAAKPPAAKPPPAGGVTFD